MVANKEPKKQSYLKSVFLELIYYPYLFMNLFFLSSGIITLISFSLFLILFGTSYVIAQIFNVSILQISLISTFSNIVNLVMGVSFLIFFISVILYSLFNSTTNIQYDLTCIILKKIKNDLRKSKNKKGEINEKLFKMHLYILRDTFASIWTQTNYPQFLLEAYKKQKNNISKILLDINKRGLETKTSDIDIFITNLKTYTFSKELRGKQYSIKEIDSLMRYSIRYFEKPFHKFNSFITIFIKYTWVHTKWAVTQVFRLIIFSLIILGLSQLYPPLVSIIQIL